MMTEIAQKIQETHQQRERELAEKCEEKERLIRAKEESINALQAAMVDKNRIIQEYESNLNRSNTDLERTATEKGNLTRKCDKQLGKLRKKLNKAIKARKAAEKDKQTTEGLYNELKKANEDKNNLQQALSQHTKILEKLQVKFGKDREESTNAALEAVKKASSSVFSTMSGLSLTEQYSGRLLHHVLKIQLRFIKEVEKAVAGTEDSSCSEWEEEGEGGLLSESEEHKCSTGGC
jgi:chromosome segregation ATPase